MRNVEAAIRTRVLRKIGTVSVVVFVALGLSACNGKSHSGASTTTTTTLTTGSNGSGTPGSNDGSGSTSPGSGTSSNSGGYGQVSSAACPGSAAEAGVPADWDAESPSWCGTLSISETTSSSEGTYSVSGTEAFWMAGGSWATASFTFSYTDPSFSGLCEYNGSGTYDGPLGSGPNANPGYTSMDVGSRVDLPLTASNCQYPPGGWVPGFDDVPVAVGATSSYQCPVANGMSDESCYNVGTQSLTGTASLTVTSLIRKS